jgi:hypothetical protein
MNICEKFSHLFEKYMLHVKIFSGIIYDLTKNENFVIIDKF